MSCINSAFFRTGRTDPSCPVNEGVVIDPEALLQGLFENVIEPVLDSDELLQSRPNVTRLYTTLSPGEMTIDPIFDENPDLPDVDNQHRATRFIECSDGLTPTRAPWRVELDQGQVVRGTGTTWPLTMDTQPAALRIMQLSVKGEGEVVEDNRGRVSELVAAHNRTVKKAGGGGLGCRVGVGRLPERGSGDVWLGSGWAFLLRLRRGGMARAAREALRSRRATSG